MTRRRPWTDEIMPPPERWWLRAWHRGYTWRGIEFMTVESIPDARDLSVEYLRRRTIVGSEGGMSIYVHHIRQPDADRDLHDHPRPFLSLILRGGYTESIRPSWGSVARERRHRRFGVNVMPRGRAHRIESIRPNTTTLLFLGPRRGEWGFWTDRGWVYWRTYIARKYRIVPTCTFGEAVPAVVHVALSNGCVGRPDDREQDLCLHHALRAMPHGTMTIMGDYTANQAEGDRLRDLLRRDARSGWAT